jgi:hypothetical protein
MKEDLQERTALRADKGDASARLRILLVAEDPLELDPCVQHLIKAGLELVTDTADSPARFSAKLRAQTYDVILADYGSRDWRAGRHFVSCNRAGKAFRSS